MKGKGFSSWLKRNRVVLSVFAGVIACVGLYFAFHEDKEKTTVPFEYDPETIPTMTTRDVVTLISDSGYIRYNIQAPLWLMFSEAAVPHWSFPEGLYLEKYNDSMAVNATFECDSATFLSNDKIWKFGGNVRMLNDLGDRFLTQQLDWNQQTHKITSDSFIHIEKTDRIIEGYGFESNENITQYRIHNPSMILPMSDFNRASSATPADSVATNETPDTKRRRPMTSDSSPHNKINTETKKIDQKILEPVQLSNP